MTVKRIAGSIIAIAVMMCAGCSSDQRGAEPAVDTMRPATSDINSGANKNTDDLNKGDLLDQNVGPNYKINGADNKP